MVNYTFPCNILVYKHDRMSKVKNTSSIVWRQNLGKHAPAKCERNMAAVVITSMISGKLL